MEKSNNNNISAARMTCDLCKSAAALLFCRKDTVFLCMACDTNLHDQTKHERVWMCEVCQQAPASVTCQADAAAMCVTCDMDVHSANPLASCHVRVPVVPFYSSAESVVHSTASNLIMMDPVFGYATKEENNSQLSDDDCCFNFRNEEPVNNIFPRPIADHEYNGNRYEFDCNKCVKMYCQNVFSLSMDAGVVPQENLLLDVSKQFMQRVNGGRMFCAKDREARVLRYKEKRKKRKFEKKIRYASRKAYAEMRPRIKGRFVKRTEFMPVLDVDRWWLMAETSSDGFGAGVDYSVAL